MITIGVDFHKRTSTYQVLNEQGQPLKRCKLENDTETIRDFIQSFTQPKRLAMEATRSWGLFYETTKDLVEQFHLGHPKKMVALTAAEIKNDNNDAALIAQLAHTGFLPQAYISSLSIRELRDIVRLRGFLVNQRRSVRNQVQTLIDRNVWPKDRPKSFKSPFCKRGLQWLDSLKLSERERFVLHESLLLFHELNIKIDAIHQFLRTQSGDLPGLKYLRTVPGFLSGGINAYCLLIEISDIARFKNSKGMLFYAGLIPREHSSGDKQRKGRLVKGANLHLRTVLIESTFAAVRQDKVLKAYYKNLKAKSGSGAAVIATARKLACAVYYVLKEQKIYDPARLAPSATACHS